MYRKIMIGHFNDQGRVLNGTGGAAISVLSFSRSNWRGGSLWLNVGEKNTSRTLLAGALKPNCERGQRANAAFHN